MTNLYVLIIFFITLTFELLITRLLEVSHGLLWGITIALYFMFVLYQIIMRMNEDSEKNKIKNLLYELMDTIDGIPIMNKNEKLIIKWDIVFKKLVDYKEFSLYDKIAKIKTEYIDSYVNKYPSLLKDDSIDFRKSRYNVDLNSTIKSSRKKEDKAAEELVKDEENKNKLFIRDIKGETASFCNYNSSINFDVLMKNEYVPENAEVLKIEPDPDYDGFSVWMMYQENKYNVVPRVMVNKKLINKEKWFIDHINELLNCASAIANGDTGKVLYVDNFELTAYLKDMPKTDEKNSFLKFVQLKDKMLIFIGTDKNNKLITANCEFQIGYNRFEVILKTIEIKDEDDTQIIESDKTVAMGTSYEPIVTLLERMPEVTNNIEKIIYNQDLSSIVIS